MSIKNVYYCLIPHLAYFEVSIKLATSSGVKFLLHLVGQISIPPLLVYNADTKSSSSLSNKSYSLL